MFDFDPGKIVVIGVVALIVIGPKELPRVLRQVGQAVGKMRRMAADFQGQFMDAMKEADLEQIKQDVHKLAQDSKLDVAFTPVADIKNEIAAAISAPAVPIDPVIALGETAAGPDGGAASIEPISLQPSEPVSLAALDGSLAVPLADPHEPGEAVRKAG